jgi:PDZ domain
MLTFVPCGAGTARPLLDSRTSSFAGGHAVSPSRNAVVVSRPARRSHAGRFGGAAGAVASSEFNYNIYQDSKDRSRRTIDSDERVVTLRKPLGIVLEEGQDGMVFVASVEPGGNASREDDIQEGDVLVAVSATFGDEVWSTRGVGLDRVMKSIRVRSGDFVTLILETPAELKERKQSSTDEAEARRKMARDTRGEREVLNPVTWGVSKASGSNAADDDQSIFEYGDPEQAQIDEKLKQRLKNEMAAPYEQNWILWISGGIFLLIIISVIAGFK